MGDKLPLAFAESGHGKTLLLVHGFPLNGNCWKQQVAALQAYYHVLVPDLPGFGKSPATAKKKTMESFADDLQQLIEQKQIGPVTMVGHSMGGYVALAFAKKYPKSLARLVLVATRAVADTPEVAQGRRQLAERGGQEGGTIAAHPLADK